MFDNDKDAEHLYIRQIVTRETPGEIIQAMKKDGVSKLLKADVLPRKIMPIKNMIVTREHLEKIGIVFHDDIDELFVQVTLPPGWHKVPNNGYWSYLVDEKGRNRASIGYKTAFYDRWAQIYLATRYDYRIVPAVSYNNPKYSVEKTPKVGVVLDGEKEIWRTPIYDPTVSTDIKWYMAAELMAKPCEEYLNTNFPLWTDPTAYWEDTNA
jgi:hypothetical protein